jgi:hypothetical protein
MRRTHGTKLLLGALLLVVPLAACGGGGDDGDDAVALEDVGDDGDEATTTTAGDDEDDGGDDDEATTTTADDDGDDGGGGGSGGELPDFLADFDRVCDTKVGFDGAAAYDPAAAGPHPVVLFEAFGADGDLIDTSRTLPDGWLVAEDLDFEDNAELAVTELVACGVRVEETPTGTTCDFDDDGDTVTLELIDTVIELTVYEAATGTELGSTTLEASSTECPFFVTFDPDDLRYFNEPTDDQYISALAPFVEP